MQTSKQRYRPYMMVMLTNCTALVKFPARLALALALALCLMLMPHEARADLPDGLSAGDDLRFAIFRNGDRVGTHRIVAGRADDVTEVRTEIDIKVTFAFLTLYDYSHRATETWRDGKLLRLRSNTVNDGKDEFVELEAAGSGFEGRSTEGALDLPAATGFTSYWNPAYLDAGQWLDTQDGELLAMTIEKLGVDEAELRGGRVAADRYRAASQDGAVVELWYAAGELARMRFQAFDGSVLDYLRE
jgi:hypothetical protein